MGNESCGKQMLEAETGWKNVFFVNDNKQNICIDSICALFVIFIFRFRTCNTDD